MKTKKVYQLDANGYFIGETHANESPLEPGVFAIPAGCVEKAPPAYGLGQRAKWDGSKWSVSTIPEAPSPSPEEAMKTAVAKRQALYRAESDPLKIEAEYDALISGSEPDYGPWKEAVRSIKARVPLPTGDS